MGECSAVFVLTYILSDKKFVTTVLWDKIDHIIVFQEVCSLSWKHCMVGLYYKNNTGLFIL